MTYTFAQIAENVHTRVRNLSFENCAGVCYGVPLPPEQAMRIEQAGEKLANYAGHSEWRLSIVPIFDGNHAYIEVSVRPGSIPPTLPAAVDGIPVFIAAGKRVPQRG